MPIVKGSRLPVRKVAVLLVVNDDEPLEEVDVTERLTAPAPGETFDQILMDAAAMLADRWAETY